MARSTTVRAGRIGATCSALLALLLVMSPAAAASSASSASSASPASPQQSAAGHRHGAGDGRTVYVALGDSYSSGEANPPFDKTPADCHRGRYAWPRLVGTWLRWQTVLLACSGATTEAITGPYKGQPPQADELADVDPAADVVSITIGGNDAGFGRVLAQCLLADCAAEGAALESAQDFIRTALPERLDATYAAVRKAAPQADLAVVGYPQLFPSRAADVAGCAWLSDDERRGLNRTARLLNRAIAAAANRAGALYVDVSRSLRGHELCSEDSWVYPLGQDLNTSSWAHPTLRGQKAIAARVALAIWWLAY